MNPQVTAFFDEPTNTATYLVRDPQSKACAIVDSVLDLDYAAGRISTGSADRIIEQVEKDGLETDWILETHVHADQPPHNGEELQDFFALFRLFHAYNK